jgi:BirA family biotin operon repressor/biotin-[acetyl-CoA-carboxylase] ligase
VTFKDLRRPPLDVASLSAALTRSGALWREVEVLEASPSTNAVVADRARRGAGEGLVVVAEHQTAGRGRLDRVWTTPPRAALTFSFLLTPRRIPPGRWPWLPLLAGVAVAEAVVRVAEVPCMLKWPNDVLVADRKLAGILVERVEGGASPAEAAGRAPRREAHAVVGVGINVSTGSAELPVAEATSLALEGAATTDRSVLLRAILRTFDALYTPWAEDLGDPARGLQDSYVRRCSTIGKRVRVELPNAAPVLGEATGIGVDGRLLVDTGADVVAFGAGDVVHVRGARPDSPA